MEDKVQEPVLLSEEELKLELMVLRAIDRVKSAQMYPVGTVSAKLNSNRVIVNVDGLSKPMIVHGNPLLPSKLDAAREAKRRLAEILGPAAIEKAEETVCTKLGDSKSLSFFLMCAHASLHPVQA